MSLPSWLAEMLTLDLKLSSWQQLGLAFLLGSFVVATWSDLKYMAAQREFLEVWLAFLLGMLIHDVLQVHAGRMAVPASPSLKWVLLMGLSLLSLREVGVLFRLARGDVAALAAAPACCRRRSSSYSSWRPGGFRWCWSRCWRGDDRIIPSCRWSRWRRSASWPWACWRDDAERSEVTVAATGAPSRLYTRP